MIRRYLFALFILVLPNIGVFAQEEDDPVEKMNNIKLEGTYYTGEATAATAQEAEELAKLMLTENMDGKNVDDLKSQMKKMRIIIRRIAVWCRNLCLLAFLSSLLAVVVYRFVPVYFTPLMGIRLYEQWQADKPLKLAHIWVPLSQISHHLPQAVVASEDNLFMDHHGFDMEQIQQAHG